MSKMYEIADKSVLPDEYLPDDYTGPSAGSESQIIGAFMMQNTLNRKRNVAQKIQFSIFLTFIQ